MLKKKRPAYKGLHDYYNASWALDIAAYQRHKDQYKIHKEGGKNYKDAPFLVWLVGRAELIVQKYPAAKLERFWDES